MRLAQTPFLPDYQSMNLFPNLLTLAVVVGLVHPVLPRPDFALHRCEPKARSLDTESTRGSGRSASQDLGLPFALAQDARLARYL